MVSGLDSIYFVPPCSISSPKVNLFQYVCWSSSHCHPILGTGSRKDYAVNHRWHLFLHLIGQNLAKWPYLTVKEAGKCNLLAGSQCIQPKIEGLITKEGEKKYWETTRCLRHGCLSFYSWGKWGPKKKLPQKVRPKIKLRDQRQHKFKSKPPNSLSLFSSWHYPHWSTWEGSK